MADFVVQFGIASDPDETSKWGDTIKDDPVVQSNKMGTITYATGGANTRTTQLFVNLKDNTSLDKQGFSPFGKVVSGMDVLTAIHNPTPNQSGGVNQGSYEDKGNDWILKEYPGIDLIENTALFEGKVGKESIVTEEAPDAEDEVDEKDEAVAFGDTESGAVRLSLVVTIACVSLSMRYFR